MVEENITKIKDNASQFLLIKKLQFRFVPKQSHANIVHYFPKHGSDVLLKAR